MKCITLKYLSKTMYTLKYKHNNSILVNNTNINYNLISQHFNSFDYYFISNYL